VDRGDRGRAEGRVVRDGRGIGDRFFVSRNSALERPAAYFAALSAEHVDGNLYQ
jgi:hypothetical protein